MVRIILQSHNSERELGMSTEWRGRTEQVIILCVCFMVQMVLVTMAGEN